MPFLGAPDPLPRLPSHGALTWQKGETKTICARPLSAPLPRPGVTRGRARPRLGAPARGPPSWAAGAATVPRPVAARPRPGPRQVPSAVPSPSHPGPATPLRPPHAAPPPAPPLRPLPPAPSSPPPPRAPLLSRAGRSMRRAPREAGGGRRAGAARIARVPFLHRAATCRLLSSYHCFCGDCGGCC